MTDCERNLERISAYLDGEVTAAEAAELQLHLEVCPLCKSLLDDLTAIRDNLAEGLPEGLPEGLHERIMDAVREQQREARRKPPVWRKWGVMAAALAIVVLSATYGRDLLGMSYKSAADTAAVAESAMVSSNASESMAAADAGTGDMLMAGTAEDDSAKSKEDAVSDSADGSGQRSQLFSASTAAPEAELQRELPASAGNTAAGTVYCGVLTLESLPPELEDYAPADGASEFTLPADEFESVVGQLNERGAAFVLERPEGYEEAEYGLVILQPGQG